MLTKTLLNMLLSNSSSILFSFSSNIVPPLHNFDIQFPQQHPQAAMHLSPFERQEHCLLLHRFFDVAWHLHFMTIRNSSGRRFLICHITGTNNASSNLHPQTFGSKVLSMIVFHSWTWKYAQYICIYMKPSSLFCWA